MEPSERHRRITDLFLAACAVPRDELNSFLDEHCPDAELRREVEGMLALDARGPGFLDAPALGPEFHIFWRSSDPAPDGPDLPSGGETSEAPPPERLGSYSIIEILGEGGVGVVYLAEQDRPRRRVALKVLGRGILSRRIMRRFEHEADVLGRLRHPGIAQIYESGVASTGFGPQPFFAMEYVDGEPLTRYAEAHGLSIEARVELIAKVSDAVHHAHQKGVIHRDLKPSNILVEASGEPKVLDFGVARVTDADLRTTTIQTGKGELLGTVPYMSPEQTTGAADELDVRSDVYALGVVAYELLSGHLPYDVRSRMVHEAIAIIREQEPVPLGARDPRLRGDLETILAKALEKDTSRRYASASEMAADLRRFLADEPILARPATRAEHLRRFVRRNRALVGGAVALIAVLSAGIVGTSVMAARAYRAEAASRELALAEATQREVAEAINEFINEDVLAAAAPSNKPGEGRDVLLRDVLDEAAGRIDDASAPEGRFADKPLVEAGIRATLGDTYMSLGELDAAEGLLDRALELRSDHLGAEHPDTLLVIASLATVYRDQSRCDLAEPLLDRVLAVRRRVLGPSHPDTLEAMNELSGLYLLESRLADAEVILKELFAIVQRELGEGDFTTISTGNNLGNLYRFQGRHEDAERILVPLLEACERTRGADDRNTFVIMSNLGRLRLDQKRYTEANALALRALEGCTEILGAEHPFTLANMQSVATTYVSLGQYEEALGYAERALEIERRTLGEDHFDTFACMSTLANIYQKLERLDDATPLRLAVYDGVRRVLGEEHLNTFIAMSSLGQHYRLQERYDDAASVMEQAYGGLKRSYGEEHPMALSAMEELCIVYRAQGRTADAEALLSECVEIRERTRQDHPDTLSSMIDLASAYRDRGALEEALELEARALAAARRVWPDGDWRLGSFLGKHGATLLELGRLDEAEAALLEAHAILEDGPAPAREPLEDTRAHLVKLYEAKGEPE